MFVCVCIYMCVCVREPFKKLYDLPDRKYLTKIILLNQNIDTSFITDKTNADFCLNF